MVNISNYYVCWLNFSIYRVMLIEFILKVNVDDVNDMWIVVDKWWIGSECEWFVCNWLTCVLLSRIYNYGICWVEDWDIELLMIKEWFELLGLWIGICEYRLKWWICELFVFNGNELVV